jgi:plasmid stabilization system protein ParE
MSRRIRRRPQAEADLTDPFVYYLTNAGHEVAERFLTAVEETARRLLDRPGIGARGARSTSPACRICACIRCAASTAT